MLLSPNNQENILTDENIQKKRKSLKLDQNINNAVIQDDFKF